MNFVDATASYERWLGKHLPLVKRDLKHKHETMRADCFAFLRGTYYRWAQLWPAVCPELADAPRLLGVGDLHLANFGTWRDADARLVWGVNDFDEASPIAYTNDLVRLATSALLAGESGQLRLSAKRATREILDGYTRGLKDKDAAPLVLEEDNEELRQIRLSDVRDPAKFWRKLRTETWGTAGRRENRDRSRPSRPHERRDIPAAHGRRRQPWRAPLCRHRRTPGCAGRARGQVTRTAGDRVGTKSQGRIRALRDDHQAGDPRTGSVPQGGCTLGCPPSRA